jgi:hypothetical protein
VFSKYLFDKIQASDAVYATGDMLEIEIYFRRSLKFFWRLGFWDFRPRLLANGYWRFEESARINFQEELKLQQHSCDNLKSCRESFSSPQSPDPASKTVATKRASPGDNVA